MPATTSPILTMTHVALMAAEARPSDYWLAEQIDEWLEWGHAGIEAAKRCVANNATFVFRTAYLHKIRKAEEVSR